jgi:hypothetical protein
MRLNRRSANGTEIAMISRHQSAIATMLLEAAQAAELARQQVVKALREARRAWKRHRQLWRRP